MWINIFHFSSTGICKVWFQIQGMWPRSSSWTGGCQFLLNSHLTWTPLTKIRKKQGLPLHYEFNGMGQPGPIASLIGQLASWKSRITSSQSKSLWKARKTLTDVTLLTRKPLNFAHCNSLLSELKIYILFINLVLSEIWPDFLSQLFRYCLQLSMFLNEWFYSVVLHSNFWDIDIDFKGYKW